MLVHLHRSVWQLTRQKLSKLVFGSDPLVLCIETIWTKQKCISSYISDSFITVQWHFAQILVSISALASDGIILYAVETSFGHELHCSGACPETDVWQ